MVSVVITACRDEKGLYLTYYSLKQQLEALGEEHEFIVVADGGSEVKWEKNYRTTCLRGLFGSPQAARDAGIRVATSSTVLVIEGHVILGNLLALLHTHHARRAALTFPRRVAEGTELFDVYGHETDWDGNLWHKRLRYQRPCVDEPYRVAQFGNSCFILDANWYLEAGGYTDLMKGWGGEEPFICLKAWMLGRECWLSPRAWHAHYLTAGAHADRADLEKNLQVLAYVIAGRRGSLRLTPAIEAERQRICAGPFQGDAARLRGFFQREGVLS